MIEVGMRVRVVSNHHGPSSDDLIGEEGVVTEIDGEDFYNTTVDLDNHGSCPFDDTELEVIK